LSDGWKEIMEQAAPQETCLILERLPRRQPMLGLQSANGKNDGWGIGGSL
jgi:hypothetical protein